MNNTCTEHCMSTQMTLSTGLFVYGLLPACIIMGIWLIVQNIKRDEDDKRVRASNMRFVLRYYLRRALRSDDVHPDDIRGMMKAARRGEKP